MKPIHYEKLSAANRAPSFVSIATRSVTDWYQKGRKWTLTAVTIFIAPAEMVGASSANAESL
jgi:hypothetical protein